MATKLELIQQNRASWMSYLDAARQATQSLDVNSDANRLARLEAKWMGDWRAADNLRNVQTWNNTMVDETKFTQSTWIYSKENAQNAISSTFTQAPSQTINWQKLSTPSTPVVTGWDPVSNSQGNTSTITWGSFWKPWSNWKQYQNSNNCLNDNTSIHD